MRVQMAEATRKQERADAAKMIRGKNYQVNAIQHWYFHTPPMMGMRHEAEAPRHSVALISKVAVV